MTIPAGSGDIQAYLGEYGEQAFTVNITKDDVAFPDNTYTVKGRILDQDKSFIKEITLTYVDDGEFKYTWASGDLSTDDFSGGQYYIAIVISKASYLKAVPTLIELDILNLPESS